MYKRFQRCCFLKGRALFIMSGVRMEKGKVKSHFTSFTSGLITKCNTRKDTIWHIFYDWGMVSFCSWSSIHHKNGQNSCNSQRETLLDPFLSGGLSESISNKLYHVSKWKSYPEKLISSCVPSCLRSFKAFGKMCYLLSILPYKTRDLKLKAN